MKPRNAMQVDADLARVMVAALLEVRERYPGQDQRAFQLECFLASVAGYIAADMPRAAAVLRAAYSAQVFPVHAAADMREAVRRTRCGLEIRTMPKGHLWSGRHDRITCEDCRKGTR